MEFIALNKLRMAVESVTNYRRVSDWIASSGQPDENQFKEIAQAGYKDGAEERT
ncbi:hypothetical protein [Candidatus Thiodiazotropha endoloripes]|uniref:hypothetical protein n=1 Tax=Candidatus Thiodiazotropha endoloripes TaxID=1818881 RepID=UPI0012D79B78|nr:hypothetical protein [Candidatus Thiodiazotropha endoloripes]MCG7915022.1 hypothetical protein [Candidatus Thiodiazotropha weberae]